MSGTITMTGEEYDALHAEAEALRAALHGIASVNPAERGIEWAKSYASDGLKGAGSELYARWLDSFKEAEALRAQVSALQSDANSWQSGYDKGREDGAKAADGWKDQHARDSVELRRLCAERDALAAELEAIKGRRLVVGTNSYIAKLKAQLDQAIIQREHWKQLAHKRNYIEVSETDPESRTESVWRVDADAVRRMWAQIRHMEAALAEGDAPQPGPDVRALAASLYQACGAYDMPERILDALSAAANGEPFTHMIDGLLPCVPPSGEGVRALVEALEDCAASLAWNCFGECRAVHAGPIMPAAKALDTARAALATHRQAQRQA